jgi:hypothetical protein
MISKEHISKMEDIWVKIINKYIDFYKREIKNVDLFNGIDVKDFSSTSEQMELFNIEIEKYKNLGEIFQSLIKYEEKDDDLKTYIITENSINILSSDSLLSVLIESINLESENPKNKYNVVLKEKIKKVRFSN